MKDLSRKVHLHGRKVDCYSDVTYEDAWGYCDCWDNIDRNTVCGYWEYCEHDDPTICYQRPRSTLPKRQLQSLLEPDCVKLGDSYEDRIGYCECGAVDNGRANTCWWVTFEEQNTKCRYDHTFASSRGACLPNEEGKYIWYMFARDVQESEIRNPSEIEAEDVI
jgi:hypothetical protein